MLDVVCSIANKTYLSIGKDSAIVTIQYVVHGRLYRVVEYILLLRLHVKYPIEREGILELSRLRPGERLVV